MKKRLLILPACFFCVGAIVCTCTAPLRNYLDAPRDNSREIDTAGKIDTVSFKNVSGDEASWFAGREFGYRIKAARLLS